jgi:hypothetical protein
MRLCEPRDRIKAPGASPGTAGRNATPSAMPSGVHAVVAWRRKALRNVTVPRLAPGGFYGRHSPGRTPLPFGRSGNKSPGREPGDCGSECHRRLPCRPGSTPWLHGHARLYATSQSPGSRLGAFMAGTSSRVCAAYEWAQVCNTGDPGVGGGVCLQADFFRAGGMATRSCASSRLNHGVSVAAGGMHAEFKAGCFLLASRG